MGEVLLKPNQELEFGDGERTSNEIEFKYEGAPVEIVELGIHLRDFPGSFVHDRGDGQGTVGEAHLPMRLVIRTPRGDFQTTYINKEDLQEVSFRNPSFGGGLDHREAVSVPFGQKEALLLDPGDVVTIRARRYPESDAAAPKTTLWIDFFGEKELL